MSQINRRKFLITSAGLLTLSHWPVMAASKYIHRTSFRNFNSLDIGPFSSITSNLFSKFDGDNEDLPHEILWNKSEYLRKLGSPIKTLSTEVLIVGGGMAGLCCSYYLKNKQVTLLEQDPRLGGNSKGYSSPNQKISQGAAYVTIPDKGSDLESFFRQIGLASEGQREFKSPVIFKNKMFEDFVNTISGNDLDYFKTLHNRLKEIYENEFPEIPLTDNNQQTRNVLNWDQISFKQWLENEFKQPIPIRIQEFFQMYGWSSFCGSIDEISAAQFLNFISAETEGIWAFPGGNAEIANRLYEQIVHRTEIHSEAFVVDIEKTASGYKTLYIKDRQLFQIASKYVVFAAPKFLCDKLLTGTSFQSAIKASESIEYRSYLVANVELTNAIELPGYDQFVLSGEVPPSPSAMKPPKLGFADIVNGSWAKDKNNLTKFLTIYRPLPYSGARQFLFNPAAFEKNKNAIITELQNRGLSEKQIKSITISRWGHALPVASVNALASEQLSAFYPKPNQDFYFIGQDVYCNPAFECAYETAKQAAEFINAQL